MRIPIVGGNWKMNKTIPEAVNAVEDLKTRLEDVEGVEIAIFPPFTALKMIQGLLNGTNIGLGAQNMYYEERGAYTGEISPLMLQNVGCRYVVLGHSERRGYFGETNELINEKLKTALSFELTPIVCVGEKLKERKKGKATEVVNIQIRKCLQGIGAKEAERVVIAYEPVWAIGTGETATPSQAEEMHRGIRRILRELYGEELANSIRIQYGGSVKPKNIEDLMREEDIDGALVGGASLNAESFASIVKGSRRL
ncbi:MAG: triose-phosphate isomerase [Candidatus Aerophobetes bacterium]|nr:triose-phosphate isomerase [Candidatus Aerophobetes bacterium]